MNRDTAIGPHDPMGPFAAPRLGWWIECECGWIGSGAVTESAARAQHQRHTRQQ